jgi:diguanylate cyclase (GGDEF)-like protein
MLGRAEPISQRVARDPGRWKALVRVVVWLPLVLGVVSGAWWVHRIGRQAGSLADAGATAVTQGWARLLASHLDRLAADLTVVGDVLVGPRSTLASLPADRVPLLENFIAHAHAFRVVGIVSPAGRSVWWASGPGLVPLPIRSSPAVLGRVPGGWEVGVPIRGTASSRVDFLVEGVVPPAEVVWTLPEHRGVSLGAITLGGTLLEGSAVPGGVAASAPTAFGPLRASARLAPGALAGVVGGAAAAATLFLLLAAVAAALLDRFIRTAERARAELAWRGALERALGDLPALIPRSGDRGRFLARAARVLSGVPGLGALPLEAPPWLELAPTSPAVAGWLAGARERIAGVVGRELEHLELLARLRTAEAAARAASERDALTGLANRTALAERLAEVTRAGGPESGAVCILVDLDDFKEVNDTLGHLVGDSVLVEVARRVRRAVERTLPGSLVARYGGDEFVVVAQLPLDDERIAELARHLAREVRRPVRLGEGVTASVGVSVGWAWWPRDALDGPALMHAADQVMYEVKRSKAAPPRAREPSRARALVDPWGPEAEAAMVGGAWRGLLEPLVHPGVLEAVEAGPTQLARAVADDGPIDLKDVEPRELGAQVAIARLELAREVAEARRRALQARWRGALRELAARRLGTLDEEASWLAAQPGVGAVAIVERTTRGAARLRTVAGSGAAVLAQRLGDETDPLSLRVAGLAASEEAVVVACGRQRDCSLVVLPEARADAAEQALLELVDAAGTRVDLVRRGVRAPIARRDVLSRLRGGGLRIAYQPIVRLDDGTVVALEALARIEDARGALLPPGAFLSLLGRGELGELFRRVLAETLEFAGSCLKPSVGVSVNAPLDVLGTEGLVGVVERALEATGVESERLTLEVLEDAGGESRLVASNLERLAALGVHRALDDVGSGGQGITRMVALAVDVLKVAPSMLAEIDRRPGAVIAALEGIVRYAEAQGCLVVLEGIETTAELEVARGLGIPLGQGFLLGRPVVGGSADALTRPLGAPWDGRFATLEGALAWHWRHRWVHPGPLEACPIGPAVPSELGALHAAAHTGEGDRGRDLLGVGLARLLARQGRGSTG